MDWTTFGIKLPAIGDDIEVIFPDADPLYMGKVIRVLEVTYLADVAWSLSTEQYFNAVVRENYQWRLKQ